MFVVEIVEMICFVITRISKNRPITKYSMRMEYLITICRNFCLLFIEFPQAQEMEHCRYKGKRDGMVKTQREIL